MIRIETLLKFVKNRTEQVWSVLFEYRTLTFGACRHMKFTKLSAFLIGLIIGGGLGVGLVLGILQWTPEGKKTGLGNETVAQAKIKPKKEDPSPPVSSVEKTSSKTKKGNKVNNNPPQKKTVKPQPTPLPVNNSDSLPSADTLAETSLPNDSLELSILEDSLFIDSVLASRQPGGDSLGAAPEEEEIVVRKEEMIFSVNKEMRFIGAGPEMPDAEDSLAARLAEVQVEKPKLVYTLEFWDSPIHYKGYKMGNNKVILFGLEPTAGHCELIQWQERVYLRHFEKYYLLSSTFDFKPFQSVTDEDTLSQLRL